VTSVLSIVEVAFAKYEQDAKALDAATEAKISKLWEPGSPVQLVEFYELLARDAQKLIRSAISEGWHLKPADAIHLATADRLKVSEFHTYDRPLDKYEKLTDTKFKIVRPTAQQPVIILELANEKEKEATNEKQPKPPALEDKDSTELRADNSSGIVNSPQTESVETDSPATSSEPRPADPSHPTAVQGSDSGRAQGEATGEGTPEESKRRKD